MNYFLIASLLVISLFSCKKKKVDEPMASTETAQTLEIRVQPYYGDEIMQLDSLYTDANGKILKFTDFLFYFSQIKNGEKLLAKVALLDYRQNGTLLLSTTGNAADYSALNFNIGVDSTTNHSDPSIYSSTSPLNTTSGNGQMHWGWNPGYIFINLEGKADTLVNGAVLLDQNLSYHIGKDVNLRNKSITNCAWSTNGNVKTLNLKIDVAKLFTAPGSEINVNSEPFTHSSNTVATLTNKFLTNFYNQIIQQ